MNKQPLVLKKSLYFLDQGHALSWWKHIHTRRATEGVGPSTVLWHWTVQKLGGGGGGGQAEEKGLLGKFFLYIIFIFFPPGG